ncbi:MAG: hypothetical protein MJ252_14005 [archaeon]|nr:hypothetical protein [archaeon]
MDIYTLGEDEKKGYKTTAKEMFDDAGMTECAVPVKNTNTFSSPIQAKTIRPKPVINNKNTAPKRNVNTKKKPTTTQTKPPIKTKTNKVNENTPPKTNTNNVRRQTNRNNSVKKETTRAAPKKKTIPKKSPPKQVPKKEPKYEDQKEEDNPKEDSVDYSSEPEEDDTFDYQEFETNENSFFGPKEFERRKKMGFYEREMIHLKKKNDKLDEKRRRKKEKILSQLQEQPEINEKSKALADQTGHVKIYERGVELHSMKLAKIALQEQERIQLEDQRMEEQNEEILRMRQQKQKDLYDKGYDVGNWDDFLERQRKWQEDKMAKIKLGEVIATQNITSEPAINKNSAMMAMKQKYDATEENGESVDEDIWERLYRDHEEHQERQKVREMDARPSFKPSINTYNKKKFKRKGSQEKTQSNLYEYSNDNFTQGRQRGSQSVEAKGNNDYYKFGPHKERQLYDVNHMSTKVKMKAPLDMGKSNRNMGYNVSKSNKAQGHKPLLKEGSNLLWDEDLYGSNSGEYNDSKILIYEQYLSNKSKEFLSNDQNGTNKDMNSNKNIFAEYPTVSEKDSKNENSIRSLDIYNSAMSRTDKDLLQAQREAAANRPEPERIDGKGTMKISELQDEEEESAKLDNPEDNVCMGTDEMFEKKKEEGDNVLYNINVRNCTPFGAVMEDQVVADKKYQKLIFDSQ